MNQLPTTQSLIRQLGKAELSVSAYDTAWLARLGEMDDTLSGAALDWIRQNQLDDGGWGESQLEYHHERLVGTLAAMLALAHAGEAEDLQRIERAKAAAHRHASLLHQDTAGPTVGFELLVPALLKEAGQLGLMSDSASPALQELAIKRDAKLSRLPHKKISRHVTLAHSLEMVGTDFIELLDLDQLQDSSGSISCSPAATSFYLTQVLQQPDAAALEYLRSYCPNGHAPYIAPIDIFEVAWGLWNFALTGLTQEPSYTTLWKPLLGFLADLWIDGKGVAGCSGYELYDGDTSSVVYQMLVRHGYSLDIDCLLKYERQDHFATFPLETHYSVSGNVHILGALFTAGFASDHPLVQKILSFMERVRSDQGCWFDKWNISPYYTTAHGIIEVLAYQWDGVSPSIDWLLRTQRADGSWGYYLPTAEETAYSLQALIMARRSGLDVPTMSIASGVQWLSANVKGPYPSLWIGKTLYCPTKIVETTIISALMLAEQEGYSMPASDSTQETVSLMAF